LTASPPSLPPSLPPPSATLSLTLSATLSATPSHPLCHPPLSPQANIARAARFWWLPLAGVTVAITTIVVCFIVSQSLKHYAGESLACEQTGAYQDRKAHGYAGRSFRPAALLSCATHVTLCIRFRPPRWPRLALH
jgi:hypothetical protein